MNKKKLVTSLVTTSMLGGLLVGGMSASAAQVDSDKTKVEFGFIKDYNPPKPAPAGDITLRWTPKAFQFGNAHTVVTSSAPKTYDEINTTGGVGRYLVVDDQRPTAAGNEWKLEAALSDLEDSASLQLAGAEIDIDLGTQVYDYTGSNEPVDADITTPIATAIALPSATSITLAQPTDGGGTVEVSTGPGTIQGAYATKMTNIKLTNVAQLATYDGKQFSGDITWTLSDNI